ncbi:GDP-mannose-dependent alpha-mannosyltransferase [Tsuneonella dongtanensis]|uniref:GDP-mannose-dependent alpha-mannosyltransferase n=1 Tax=Tsuneonella dongtanensis TaxID=692370 RepID=A0A1B2AD31_9SPHN|nr:glycosyltransferase family 1 protein [Tsuneonella dongtanensis]ANY20053.1 GDP-mannose-dependent alpha-mannosyltransferase [Tsuneonella dongtanensis]
MQVSDLRIALFSGNYAMTVDGANKALNRLVDYLLRQGAQVRVYSPTIEKPPFEPKGELVSLPSIAIPGRSEYRVPAWLGKRVREDLAAFDPHVVHISSPDFAAREAASWARERNLPVVASVHTRFETYPRYYRLGFMEPAVEAWLRKLYRRCDALVTPSPSMIDTLREQKMNRDIGLWSRGVEHQIFNPERRDHAWRRELGFADGDVVVGFLGRLVLEKGLDVFGDVVAELERREVPHKVLVIGDGPARAAFEDKMPTACFVGFQGGADLGRAVASMDVLLNPSVTETFGNVTLEAMACGVPVVAADATGAASLVEDGINGYLVPPRDAGAYADRIAGYVADPALRIAHGQAGADRAKAFEWDAINKAVADTYLRVLAVRNDLKRR